MMKFEGCSCADNGKQICNLFSGRCHGSTSYDRQVLVL